MKKSGLGKAPGAVKRPAKFDFTFGSASKAPNLAPKAPKKPKGPK